VEQLERKEHEWRGPKIGRRLLRRIGRSASEIPDPVARLRYLRQRTSELPFPPLAGRRGIPWQDIAIVGVAAATLAVTILLWRTI
jgi:hypothetical protein